MKSSNLLTICTVALGTAAITVATLGTGSLEAGKDGTPAENPKPKLVAHGVELSLAAANGQTFKAGDEPAFELTALNTNAQPANICVRLAVSATSPADMYSRVVMAPGMICQEERQLTLQPQENKTIVISPKAKLPENKFISVSLMEVDPSQTPAAAPAPATNSKLVPGIVPQVSLTMLSFSTVVPKPGVPLQPPMLVSMQAAPQSLKTR